MKPSVWHIAAAAAVYCSSGSALLDNYPRSESLAVDCGLVVGQRDNGEHPIALDFHSIRYPECVVVDSWQNAEHRNYTY